MANIDLYFPKLLSFEGGYVNDSTDRGGATNMGVTISTFQHMGFDNNHDGVIDVADLKLETPDQAKQICKKLYWDKWQCDKIMNQSIAESLCEWVWGSGIWGIRLPQRMLHLKEDGIVGNQTLSAVNTQDQKEFHQELIEAKTQFINNLIANHPEQEKFKNGWLRRINSFTYQP